MNHGFLAIRPPWCAAAAVAAAVALILVGCAQPEAAERSPAAAEAVPAGATWGEVARAIGLPDDASRQSGVRAVVLMACSTDCPIGNSLAPEIVRLQQEFAPAGVQWFAIYPDELVNGEKVAKHQKAFSLSMPAYSDETLTVARLAGITTTPEVCVYAPGGTLVYQGRIDDSWAAIGTRRAAPTSRDLRDVLDALSRGTVPALRRTQPIGCVLPPPPRRAGA